MADLMATRRPARIATGVVCAAIALLGVLAAGSVQAATVTVAAKNFVFQPASRTVSVGDTVRWTFAGDPHSVTSGSPGSPDGRFDSGVTDPGGSFQFRFTTAGSYPYFCQVHPEQMFGTIVVSAAATAPPTVRPTTAPTVRPTAKPTTKPTTKPSPSPRPTPTPQPTPQPSPSPAPSPSPSPTPAAPESPTVAETAGTSHAVVETPSLTSEPASPAPAEPAPASGIDPAPVALVLVVLAVLVGGAVVLVRGRGRA